MFSFKNKKRNAGFICILHFLSFRLFYVTCHSQVSCLFFLFQLLSHSKAMLAVLMFCFVYGTAGNGLFTRDEKEEPIVKGEVKRAIKATFAHLCTTLTRDKCLHLPAVKGASSGDKGRFCHAFNPYL